MANPINKIESTQFPSFIVNEPLLEFENLNNSMEFNDDDDLVTIIGKLIKPEKKETQPVYRLSHQKANDIEELLVSMLPVLDSFENLLKAEDSFVQTRITIH
jgi:hypothetical protein